MYHLVLTVCLATTPDTCKIVELDATLESFTPMQCFTAAKSEVTKWASQHPKWRVLRWKCAGRKAGSEESQSP